MASPDTGQADRIEKREEQAPVSSSVFHGPDLIVALVIYAICAALYIVTTQFEEVSPLLAQNIPPEWFPRLLLVTIAIMTLVIPFEHLFLEGGKARLDSGRLSRIPLMVVLTAALLIATVGSIKYIGTLLAMVAICTLLPILWGERRWHILIPYVIIFPLTVALVFTQVLRVYFEPGLFGIEPQDLFKWTQ